MKNLLPRLIDRRLLWIAVWALGLFVAGQELAVAQSSPPDPYVCPNTGCTKIRKTISSNQLPDWVADFTGLFNGPMKQAEVCEAIRSLLANRAIFGYVKDNALEVANGTFAAYCTSEARKRDRSGILSLEPYVTYTLTHRGVPKTPFPRDPDKFSEICNGFPDFFTLGTVRKDGHRLIVYFKADVSDQLCDFIPDFRTFDHSTITRGPTKLLFEPLVEEPTTVEDPTMVFELEEE